jgi:hypothetical protein
MTHDELLANINSNNFMESRTLETPYFALRAVVELHKPSPIPDWVPTEDKLMCWCAHVYPCPTVKAIEKELYEPIA